MNLDTAIKEGKIYCILVLLEVASYIVNNDIIRIMTVANMDAEHKHICHYHEPNSINSPF